MSAQTPPPDNTPHPADRAQGAPAATPAKSAVAVAAPSSVAIATGETSSSAIAARERAAIESRFLVALHRPRDFENCRLRLLKSCTRPLFAEVARYAKPVGGSSIFGLSIRFAEEARVLWGNMDVTTMIVSDTDDRRIYRVTGVDLETNATDSIDVVVEKFVERRQVRAGMEVIGQRANTTGQIVYKIRATEDDLIVKANAQISKAKRNVILSLLPGDVKEECESTIVETTATKDAADPDAAKRKLLAAFFEMGVAPMHLAELLGHPADHINPAELTLLRTYYTALKDGEATWAEIFEAHTHKSADTSSASTTGAASTAAGTSLKDRIAEKKGATTTASAPIAAAKTDAPQEGVCEFCGANVGKGEKHKPNCETLK